MSISPSSFLYYYYYYSATYGGGEVPGWVSKLGWQLGLSGVLLEVIPGTRYYDISVIHVSCTYH